MEMKYYNHTVFQDYNFQGFQYLLRTLDHLEDAYQNCSSQKVLQFEYSGKLKKLK